jgi:hypothetical protein
MKREMLKQRENISLLHGNPVTHSYQNTPAIQRSCFKNKRQKTQARLKVFCLLFLNIGEAYA